MSTLSEIEDAVLKLPQQEFSALMRRMREREAKEWDREFEDDAKSGRLDFLIQEIESDLAGGRTRPLDEVCRDE